MSYAKTKRQHIEEKFHDEYAKSEDINKIGIAQNFSIAAQENRHAANAFGSLKDKKILDLGCGFGETAIYWAKKGAIVDAIDISSVSLRLGQKLAIKHKVASKVNFAQMTAEDLKFKSNSFDFVFGNGVLHHVDIPKSVVEIKRVLKKGGKAAFVEPLAYNPIINVYRKIAQDVRTPTERPLTYEDIKKLKKVFQKVSYTEYKLFTLLIFLWFFLVARISPNQERYWRKILKVKGFQKQLLKFLMSVDNFFLRIFPPARPWCWNIVVELQK